jgi:hypothetical protein
VYHGVGKNDIGPAGLDLKDDVISITEYFNHESTRFDDQADQGVLWHSHWRTPVPIWVSDQVLFDVTQAKLQ